MPSTAKLLGLGLIGAAAGAAAVYVVGMRTGNPAVVDRVRSFNRRIMNPQQLKTAGQPGSAYSIVEHVGRKSGQTYRTPVEAVPTDGGFVIGMVYGERSDWVRNVLAAGGATVQHDGQAIPVTDPVVLPIEAAEQHFSASERRLQRIFGVTQCLQVAQGQSLTSG